MSEKDEAEIVISRVNEIIDQGFPEIDIDLLKKAILLGEEHGIDVSKLIAKLKELTSEEVVHLK
jgi:chitinase